MFSLMGNCWSSRKGRVQRNLTLAILGLDNAGKTVTANNLLGEPLTTAPTIGFQRKDVTLGKYSLSLFDLGGGKNFRGIWTKFMAEIYGLIYLVDSSDTQRIAESTHVFKQLLENPQVKGKPVLLLANKQDKEGALDEIDICEQMRLEEIVNTNKCPCRVEMCAATKGTGRKKDPNIKEGLLWLCDMISLDYERLHNRVLEDMKIQEEQRKKETEERKARVKKIREEREKAEEEERLRTGAPVRSDSPDHPMEGDPFKRLDLEEIKKKEEALKAAKKKEKKPRPANRNENRTETAQNGNMQKGHLVHDIDDDEDIIIASPSPRHSKLSSNPPKENVIGLSRLSPLPLAFESGANGGIEHLGNGLKPHIHNSGRHLEPLDEKKTEKKRRKKLKKNKLAPIDGTLGDINDTPRPLDSPNSLPWNKPQTKLSVRGEPTLTSTLEQDDVENSDRFKWALVEDLTGPSHDNFTVHRQPNFETEDIIT